MTTMKVVCALGLLATSAVGLGLQIDEAAAGAGAADFETNIATEAAAAAQARAYALEEAEAYGREAALQEGTMEEKVLMESPVWSVKEYTLAHDPKAREVEQHRLEEQEAKRAKAKAQWKHIAPDMSKVKGSIKAAGENAKKFAVLEMQKMKAQAEQRKVEKAEMASKEKYRRHVLAVKAEKQAAQDRRVAKDEARRSQFIQHVETVQRHNEEHAAAAKIKAEAEHVRSEQRALHQREHIKRAGHHHFVKAEPGQECPQGWAAVDDREECSRAALVLGGHDDVSLQRAWADRPAGCFWHVVNGHVNFNAGEGELNRLDERVCAQLKGGSEADRVSFKEEQKHVTEAELRLAKKLQRDTNMAKVQLNERLHERV